MTRAPLRLAGFLRGASRGNGAVILATFAMALAVHLASCSDNGPLHRTYYYHPIWTMDGSLVVAGYYDNVNASANVSKPLLPITTFIIHDIATGAQTTIPLPLGSINTRYWIDREGDIVTNNGGLTFYSRTGATLATYIPPRTDLSPVQACFSRTEPMYVYAASTGGRVIAGVIRYGAQAWQPTEQSVVLDTAIAAATLDIILTSRTSFAVRLANGVVLEKDFAGATLNLFHLSPQQFAYPWQARMQLHYRSSVDSSRVNASIFARDGRGLVVLQQGADSGRVLVEGNISDFDVNEVRPQMMYETGSGDLWLATIDGLPQTRLAPHNVMGTFSYDGKRFVSVGRVNDNVDTLTVQKLF